MNLIALLLTRAPNAGNQGDTRLARVRAFAFGLTVLAVVVGGALTGAAEAGLSPDPVRVWNGLALDAIRGFSGARACGAVDAYGARLLAMLNVAMYDAVNGIVSGHGAPVMRDSALVPPDNAPPQGDIYAAASAAAHAVLAGEVPEKAAIYDAQLASDLAALGPGGPTSSGREWGDYVGTQVLAARASDGSSLTGSTSSCRQTPPTGSETQPGVSAPGQFRASWSGVQFRNLAPFGIAGPGPGEAPHYSGSGKEVVKNPPSCNQPSCLDYGAAFADVKLVGNAAILDNDKRDTFRYWSLGGGTSQPPGAWIQVALAVTADNPLPLPEATRLFALMSMALADTVAPTFYTKWFFHHWRPTTAIREADTDGNPYTDPPNNTVDTTWSARSGMVGGSPEYWSGHSSFSAAAAAALAGFFCADDIAFTLLTDTTTGNPPNAPRQYPSFSAGAAEAGRSRVVGGLHFEFSNQQALASGRGVAAEILANKLLRKMDPTHFGRCPL